MFPKTLESQWNTDPVLMSWCLNSTGLVIHFKKSYLQSLLLSKNETWECFLIQRTFEIFIRWRHQLFCQLTFSQLTFSHQLFYQHILCHQLFCQLTFSQLTFCQLTFCQQKFSQQLFYQNILCQQMFWKQTFAWQTFLP